MFPPEVPERLSREYGCTQAEWARDLPGAVRRQRLERPAAGQAIVHVDGGGRLHLSWQVLSPRQIALMRIPRLQVDFEFEAVAAADRTAFMRSFDLLLQRGGG